RPGPGELTGAAPARECRRAAHRTLDGGRDPRAQASAQGATPQGGRTRLRRWDRVLLAAVSRVLPRGSWSSLVVTESSGDSRHDPPARNAGAPAYQAGPQP